MTKRSIFALTLITLCTFIVTACSSDDNHNDKKIEITHTELPENAHSLLNRAFGEQATIQKAFKSQNTNDRDEQYEVYLVGDIKIDFDGQGVWTEIETQQRLGLPMSFLQTETPEILRFQEVNTYAQGYIENIDINYTRTDYEVELVNGTEFRVAIEKQ